jgi:hypothetical protein
VIRLISHALAPFLPSVPPFLPSPGLGLATTTARNKCWTSWICRLLNFGIRDPFLDLVNLLFRELAFIHTHADKIVSKMTDFRSLKTFITLDPAKVEPRKLGNTLPRGWLPAPRTPPASGGVSGVAAALPGQGVA